MVPVQEESNQNPKSQYFVRALCHQMMQQTEQQVVAAIIPSGDDKFRDIRRNHHPCSQREGRQHQLNARGRRPEETPGRSHHLHICIITSQLQLWAQKHLVPGTSSGCLWSWILPLAAHRDPWHWQYFVPAQCSELPTAPPASLCSERGTPAGSSLLPSELLQPT